MSAQQPRDLLSLGDSMPATTEAVLQLVHLPEKNAAILGRVLGAGAVLSGKTDLPELGRVGPASRVARSDNAGDDRQSEHPVTG